MHTNLELVAFAKKALAENWGYCLGSFGNILTPAFLNAKLKQGYGVGAYNSKHQTYLKRFINKRVTDCYGLVKGFVWWNNGNVKYIASQDRNQEGAYNAAREKGPISNIPEIPGLVLWMRGHAGVYIGNSEFIECVGAPVGMRKGRIANGRVVSGSRFTHWFKDTYITYTGATATPGLKNYLESGDRGAAVTTLQDDLNKMGYRLVVDGSFGPATMRVVRDFQSKNGLIVDGVAGINTRKALADMIKRINNNKIKLNIRGKAVMVPGELINGTNYVKIDGRNVTVRVLAKVLGLNVRWDAATKTVMLE